LNLILKRNVVTVCRDRSERPGQITEWSIRNDPGHAKLILVMTVWSAHTDKLTVVFDPKDLMVDSLMTESADTGVIKRSSTKIIRRGDEFRADVYFNVERLFVWMEENGVFARLEELVNERWF